MHKFTQTVLVVLLVGTMAILPGTGRAEASVAEKLAIIDGASGRESSYEFLLAKLRPKCGTTSIGVADIAVRGTQLMKEYNDLRVSAFEFLQAMDTSIPDDSPPLKCGEIAAALIVLAGQ